ncbi:MAG: hypothetical protein HQL73_09105 [Magnetococcales bacterium]|nr:hypothetical protein [Magnetococcales bacterium]
MMADTVGGSTEQTLLTQSLEAFQSVDVGDNRVVISVLDSLSLGDGTVFGKDYRSVGQLSLFAENILLSDKFSLSKGIVSSHGLAMAGQGTFDLSGTPGSSSDTPNQDPNAPGVAGGPGKPGGKFWLYLEDGTAIKSSFAISAHGGAGGAGQQGTDRTAGGDGGDGGPGGEVTVAVGSPSLAWLASMRTAYALSTLGAKQEAVKELVQTLPTNLPASLLNRLNDALAATNDVDFTRSLEDAALQLSAIQTGFASTLRTCVDVSGGIYGVYGDGKTNGKDGTPGKPGSYTGLLFGTPMDWVGDKFPQFFLIHPSQCARFMERIKLDYWRLDPVTYPDGVADLIIRLLRLQARTQPFARAAVDSLLVKYYNRNEAFFGAVNAVASLAAIYQESSQYLSQIKQGLDLFGYNSNHVPLGSLSFYQTLLKALCDNFSVLETAYNNYFKALQTQKATTDQIIATRQRQAITISNAQSQLSSLKSLTLKTARVIDGYQTILPPLKQAVEDKIKALEDKIKNHFDFNFDTFFQSLTTLAFAPESSFMALTQAGSFLYNGAAKVTDDKGLPVNKSYLVGQLKAVKADVNSIMEGYQALDNGLLAPDDPGAGKLVAEEGQILKFFSSFYSSFPKELDELKKAFQAYIDQVEARNNQILQYNAMVTLMVQNHELIQTTQAQNDKLNDTALAAMKPDLPDLVTFVSSMYYDARTQVMETLDLTARAFRFWALSDRNIISQAYGGKSLPQIDSVALIAAQDTLLSQFRQAVENFGTNSSKFPAGSGQPGLIYQVPSLQVDLFRQLNQLMLPIVAATSDSSGSSNIFAGMANVRILQIRVWVPGAKVDNDRLQVRITHTGNEQIVATSGEVFRFSHEPVNKLFIYAPSTLRVIEEANFGVEQSLASGGSATTYAALGPFTSWHVTVDPKDNVGLDLSGVTGVQLEFHGTNYAFDG